MCFVVHDCPFLRQREPKDIIPKRVPSADLYQKQGKALNLFVGYGYIRPLFIALPKSTGQGRCIKGKARNDRAAARP